MFQSHDPLATFEMASRVLTPVRLMLSDKPGQSCEEALSKLVGRHKCGTSATVQACSRPRPLPSCIWNLDKALQGNGPLLKLAAPTPAVGTVLGVFNIGPSSSKVSEMLTRHHLNEAVGGSKEEIFVYASRYKKAVTSLPEASYASPIMDLHLDGTSSDILSLARVFQIPTSKGYAKVACLGTLEHLAGMNSVVHAKAASRSSPSSLSHTTDSGQDLPMSEDEPLNGLLVRCTISGTLGFLIKEEGGGEWAITVDGKSKPLQEQRLEPRTNLRLLTVDLHVSESSDNHSSDSWTVVLSPG